MKQHLMLIRISIKQIYTDNSKRNYDQNQNWISSHALAKEKHEDLYNFALQDDLRLVDKGHYNNRLVKAVFVEPEHKIDAKIFVGCFVEDCSKLTD